MPIVVGVLLGAFAGSRILPKTNVKRLRLLFSVVICMLALSMMYNGLMGNL
jgi:uncharacterized membrane protein YfcA